MEKSLNQQWKESGTTLSYREWRIREDEKMASFDGVVIPQPTVDSSNIQNALKDLQTKGGYKTETSNKTIFGINKYVLVFGALIVVGAIGYKIYKKNK
jgi:hypothetical protein